MIVFDLKCRKAHVFEAWFRDGASFDAQVAAGKVQCPVCGSKKVEKALMAPNVAKGQARETSVSDSEKAAEIRRKLKDIRQHVEENCDYVGAQFAEEARKIHYGEEESRGIYGETSDDEAKALEEEGVAVQKVPWLPRENS